MKNIVLIVIDAQEDFTRGAFRNEEAIQALPKIAEVIKYIREDTEGRIYYTMDTHTSNYLYTLEGKNLPIPHCIAGTPGWEICPEVRTPNMIIYEKSSFGYNGWHWNSMLEDADEIWLCGFCTDICVSANFQIIKASYPNIPIVVIEDACAGVTPEHHEAALKVMQSCQATVVKWNELKEVK